MHPTRRMKIVATLGPGSSDPATIAALFDAGVNVFRLNMSHGSHADTAARHAAIRALEAERGRPIAILADLQGPKLRCGTFANGREIIVAGERFRFDLDEAPGDATRVGLPHPEIFAALQPGSIILVNDGNLRLRVEERSERHADCTVLVGGAISDRKGVNLPDVVLPLAALTPKDREDLEFACTMGVDWVALSFVQRPEDMDEARALVAGRAAVLAKIEKPSAVAVFDEILARSDAIMVARGDLGVELPVEEVPPIQKRLIRACRRAAKPVIVATQMLESMVSSPVPTRAEVSDVATAIYEGADAVMLSAESAVGQYPVEAVGVMVSVALQVENDATYRPAIDATRVAVTGTIADGVVAAARTLSEATPSIRAICCFTHSGSTANLVARERPARPILALTPFEATARRLCLTWGVTSVRTVEPVERFKMAVISAVRAACKIGLATREDDIVVTAGIPFNVAGTTNILRVAPCDEARLRGAEPV
ncbi:pyruvate kinase [Acuticoccus sp. I52.16.1]|uniref:pyruvate kinase n=1 Tax=Acuticoccus sp. I52.16.1 TaxID=2928472 RepID=UPI001FD2E124|nr:pyruvate kinase [Acuticoccus sp. I52.16.1]UOM35739.1 pyruvate kinase [Acuticoccus sp. I52.16.1]